ncbi:hypothetical protein [Saccharopolyspora spinosa]|uniref:HNH endonuclease n=1 Tax=Saccharopolyspora spinosa TaxID=60894 RepID=A0A2N3XZ40_SACSN|nr:hypothetical protein [Saccharopolyspora spinosa]PKW15956.1 hypothetical protein A8926_3738 [Saccharopolyspora spinosa]
MSQRTARDLVAARSGWICEVCGSATATNFHHRKNASQGGLWLPSNGLHLCGSGTTGCHGRITQNPADAYRLGWSVPSWQDPRAVTVFVFSHGMVLLDDAGRYLHTDQEVPCRAS